MVWAQMNVDTAREAMKTLKKRNVLQQMELKRLFEEAGKRLDAYQKNFGDEGVEQIHKVAQRAWDNAVKKRKAGRFFGVDNLV